MKKFNSISNVPPKSHKKGSKLGDPLKKTTSALEDLKDMRIFPHNINEKNEVQEAIKAPKKSELKATKSGAPLAKTASVRGRVRNLRDETPISLEKSESEITKSEDYFKSYDRLSIHSEMLKDRVRTLTYKDAICDNKHLFKNKVVLDVGCGTGILSLFAVKAGAALVIGVDCSNIIDLAQEIVEDQGPEFSDRIVLVKGRLEDICELPRGVETVDIIISEWMGYCLLFESMLDTVLYAREKWLKRGGLIFPDKVSLYITAMEDRKKRDKRFNFWHDVYGFNLSCIRKWFDKLAVVDNVDGRKIITDDCLVKEFDLYKIQKSDLAFTAPVVLTAFREHEIQALVTFFTVEFTHCHTPTKFSKFPLFDENFFR